MKKIKRKVFSILCLALIFTFIFTPFIRAETENKSGILIDGNMEDNYIFSEVVNNHSIYYYPSETDIYFFIQFNISLERKQLVLYLNEIEYNLSNETVKIEGISSLHDNFTLEFSISRDLAKDIFYIITTWNENDLIVSEMTKIEVDLDLSFEFNIFKLVADIIENIGIVTFLFMIGMTLLIIIIFRLYTYQKRPTIFITSGDQYETVKLGRLIECSKSHIDQLNLFWKYRFRKLEEMNGQTKRDYQTLYCIHPFEEMRRFTWWTLNLGLFRWEFYPHYFQKHIKLPQRLWFRKQKLARTKKNYFLYGLFRIINAIVPFMHFSTFLHKHLKYIETDEMVKEINIIQMEYMQERKYFEFYTRFQKCEFFEKEGVNVWVQYPELDYMSFIYNKNEYFRKDIENEDEKIQFGEKIKNLHNSIIDTLNQRKEDQETLIRNKIIDEKDKFIFLSLFQIEDLKQLTKQYRKVDRIGDPIPKIRTIQDLNEAIRDQSDFQELRSDLSLKLQERDVLIRDLEKKLHTERERTNELYLQMEEKVEEYVKKLREDRKGRVSEKVEFSARINQLTDEIGLDLQEAIAQANKEELIRLTQEANKIKELENKLREKNMIIEGLKENSIIDISGQAKQKIINSLEDLKELKEQAEED